MSADLLLTTCCNDETIFQEDWDFLHKMLKESRTKARYIPYEIAGLMQMLQAEKLEITKQGLKVTMPKVSEDISVKKRKRPVRRKF